MKKFLLVTLLSLVLSGCGEKIEPGRDEQVSAEKVAVTLLTLQPVRESTSEAFVGSLESRDRALLVSRSSGIVTQLAVREGDPVTAGQLLLAIGDDPAIDQLQMAEASIITAEKQQATAQARLALAEQTSQRYEQLWAKQALTAQEYDQVKAELEIARQQAAMAEAELKRTSAARSAALRQSQFSRVSAPFAGRIVTLQTKPGSTILPGTPLLTVDRGGNRQARINIPERLRGSIQVGTALRVDLPALQRSFEAEVSHVQPGTDSSSRSFEVLLPLPDSEDLATGLFARASHELADEELLLIPQTAVSSRGQLTGVFLERDGILHFRLVRLGRKFDDQWEVLSGLQAGDRIVSGQLERAVDGARVES